MPPLLALILLTSPVASADFEAGLRAYQRGDYLTAYKEWLPLAEQGDVNAQHNLAIMHDRNSGTLGGNREAVKWYYRAAVQGDVEAQYKIGLIYAAGTRALPRDVVEAAKWFRRAAEQEHAEAQFQLGLMYLGGVGVPQDNEESRKWMERAERFGCMDCPKTAPMDELFERD